MLIVYENSCCSGAYVLFYFVAAATTDDMDETTLNSYPSQVDALMLIHVDAGDYMQSRP